MASDMKRRLAPQVLNGQRHPGKVSVGRPTAVKPDHPARSRFMKEGGVGTVRPPSQELTVLKSGQHSSKIGGVVRKTRWKGYPIFTLTLEERATCPRTCHHWLTCYGNHMPWAHRIEHGQELEGRLDSELGELSRRHPRGFVVRLHVLGDFYSVAYVQLWRQWLARHRPLHVYGYTSWPENTPIGEELRKLRVRNWKRFAVRLSDNKALDKGALSAAGLLDPTALNGIVCPMQLNLTKCCGTCGLCWTTTKNIVFLDH